MVRDEPLLGTGAGSFEAHWFRERSVPFHARDAHNLYLETLAELGPVGLALLLATLALPLLALPGARRYAHAPAAAAAYAAFLVHAGVDWDWELPAVTVSVIFCAAVLLAVERPEEGPLLTGRRRASALALLAPLAVVALVGHVGNRAASASIAATEAGEPNAASPRRSAPPRGRPGRRKPGSCGVKRSSSSETLGRPAGASSMRSSSIPIAGARGSTSPRRAADSSGSRPLIERLSSTRSALRSLNSEQILNNWQRRGSPPRASTVADPVISAA